MAKKGKLKEALSRHNVSQQLKAKQRAAAEAQDRKHASVLASSSGATKTKQQAKRERVRLGKEAQQNSISEISKGKRRLVEPFAEEDTILLVGEGNFSFTLSLLSEPRSHAPARVLATAYDDEETCYRKYPDAKDIVAKIRSIAGRPSIVQFGVDAGNLQANKTVMKPFESVSTSRCWSKIYFGFPHVGAGHKDELRNVLANQLLLGRFFVSAAPLLTQGTLPGYALEGKPTKAKGSQSSNEVDEDIGFDEEEDVLEADMRAALNAALPSFRVPAKAGSVLITLRNAAPYTLWDVGSLGKRLGTMLPIIATSAPALPKGLKGPKKADIDAAGARYRLWRSFEFDPIAWPGYSHRRTVGWVEGVSTGKNEDILRRGRGASKGGSSSSSSKHNGSGECRTWEFGLAKDDQ